MLPHFNWLPLIFASGFETRLFSWLGSSARFALPEKAGAQILERTILLSAFLTSVNSIEWRGALRSPAGRTRFATVSPKNSLLSFFYRFESSFLAEWVSECVKIIDSRPGPCCIWLCDQKKPFFVQWIRQDSTADAMVPVEEGIVNNEQSQR